MASELVNRLGRRGWEEAQRQLVAQGPQAIPALIEALRDDEQDLRQAQAAQTLGMMGPAATGAFPALMQALRSTQTHVRRAAAEALRRIGPPADADAAAVVATLRGLVHDWSPDIRATAAAVLVGVGQGAAAAVPELVELLADKEDEVREAAASALGRIGKAAVPALTGVLRARGRLREEQVAATRRSLWQVVEGIAANEDAPRIGGDAVQARDNLVWHVREATDYMKLLEGRFFPAVATVLAKVAPAGDESALAALEEAVQDKSPFLRDAAGQALRRIQDSRVKN
jgi:HEAT repeat protein